MHTYLLDMLVCPACHGNLTWEIADQEGERITKEVTCPTE